MIDTLAGVEGVWFFKNSFLTQFWYSFFPLKAIFYTFQGHVLIFQCGQYWFCNFMLKFWCFTQEVMGVYHYFKTQFLLNFGILFFLWKHYFMPFRTIFQYVNVASIGPAMSFRVFDVSLSRRWGSVSLFQNPILIQFGCSFFPLKAIIYTFQDHVSMCKCGQYWPCNFISKFGCFTQQAMGECIIISRFQFLLKSGVLFFPWKRWFIPSRTAFQCANVASISAIISVGMSATSPINRWCTSAVEIRFSTADVRHRSMYVQWCLSKSSSYALRSNPIIAGGSGVWISHQPHQLMLINSQLHHHHHLTTPPRSPPWTSSPVVPLPSASAEGCGPMTRRIWEGEGATKGGTQEVGGPSVWKSG